MKRPTTSLRFIPLTLVLLGFVWILEHPTVSYRPFCFWQEFFETSLEFLKLEKVEVGGIRGKALSAEVVVVFNQFNEHYALFAQQVKRSGTCLRHFSEIDTLDRETFGSCIEPLRHVLGVTQRTFLFQNGK